MLVLVFIILVNSSLGLLILTRNPKSSINRLFLVLTTVGTLWATASYLTDHAGIGQRFLWGKLAFVMATLVTVALVFLARFFPVNLKISNKLVLLTGLLAILATTFSLSNLVVKGAHFLSSGTSLDPGSLYYPYILIEFLLLAISGRSYILSRRKSNKAQRLQATIVGVGFLISFLWVLTFNVLLPVIFTNWNPAVYGPIGLVIFFSFTAYAIIRHRLFDIRLIVARSLAYILSLGTLVGIFLLTAVGILDLIFQNNLSKQSTRWIDASLAVILALIFPYLKHFFDRITNKLFFRDSYDTQVFLDDFNKALVSNYELDKLLKDEARLIEENIKPTYSLFIINKTESTAGRLIGSQNLPNITDKEIDGIKQMINSLHRKFISVDELGDRYESLQTSLQAKNIALIAKLTTKSSINRHDIGYLLIGPKKSGNLYSSQDLRTVEIVANELVIAIQNALRFEEIANFNVTLQEKVNEATRKLRKANERLKALDETKDDFISMASHQLRTPLTSVKGYLSMILEGDAGKISAPQKNMLNQAFFSSQRMVYLIADMLNVSRLKTGKFAIENTPVNLADVVEQEVVQLKETATSHSVEFNYSKPKEFPTLMLDETKIRQVIMNFSDNAIYYTPSGGHIEVKLIDKPDVVELRVIDDGMGVPDSEKHHLFTKFYRAGNARKARPDGTGLGLYMAKKVIIAQGGSLIFESQEGKGSTFGFSLSKTKLKSKQTDTKEVETTKLK